MDSSTIDFFKIPLVWIIPISTLLISIGTLIDWFLLKKEKKNILKKISLLENKMRNIPLKEWEVKSVTLILNIWNKLGKDLTVSPSDSKTFMFFFRESFVGLSFVGLTALLYQLVNSYLNLEFDTKTLKFILLFLFITIYLLIYPKLSKSVKYRLGNMLIISTIITFVFILIGYNLVDSEAHLIWENKFSEAHLLSNKKPDIFSFFMFYATPNFIFDIGGIYISMKLLRKYMQTKKYLFVYAIIDVITSIVFYIILFLIYSLIIHKEDFLLVPEIKESITFIGELFSGNYKSERLIEVPLLLTSLIPIFIYSSYFIIFGLILSPLFKFSKRFIHVLSQKKETPFLQLGVVFSTIIAILVSISTLINLFNE